ATLETESSRARMSDEPSQAKTRIDESAIAKVRNTKTRLRLFRKLPQILRVRAQNWRVLLRPGVVTAVVAIFVVAALLLVRWSNQPLTAPDVLARSIATEERLLTGSPDIAFHRTITLEERIV